MDVDGSFSEDVQNKSSLSGDLIYSNVNYALTKIAEKEGYVRYNIYKKNITTGGGNYLGILYEIDIKGETAGGSKEINVFVKQVPNGDNIKLLSISEVYRREIFVYTELSTIFTELQNKANIPMEKRFKLVKIYTAIDNDAILLENVSKRGFKTYDKMDVMKLNYAKLGLENMAMFHGLSFVIEKKMPEYFETKIKALNQLMTFDNDAKIFMNTFYKSATKKLPLDLKIKTDTWWKTAVENYIKYLQGTMTEVKSICHGDFKMNNVMYKEIEGDITEVITVDYQATHYGSPILDLIYFLYLGTDQKFRRKHLHYLKDHYYTSLERYLDYFDIRVNDVYPKKMFDNDFEKCLDYAIVICIWLLPYAMITQDDDIDINDNEAVQLGIKFNDSYYARLQGVIEDCIK